MWMGGRSNWTDNNKGGGTLKVNAMSRKILKLALTCLRLCAAAAATHILPLVRNVAIKNWLKDPHHLPPSAPKKMKR